MTDVRFDTAEDSAPLVDPLIGETIEGRFQILGLIGAGGMGQVFEAEQINLERRVALKVLHHGTCSDPNSRARFQREAKALAAVTHDHILHAYDHGLTQDGRLYLVTELLDGLPLDKVIARQPDRRMPLAAAVAILRQIASALEAVHGSLVHRDLKPHNVHIVSRSGDVKAKLLDFGIARPSGGSELTRSGIIGTPAYMSPEQIQQESTIDGRSDLYSLGVMAFELVTGKVPFRSERQIEILTAHITQRPPRIEDLPGMEHVPAQLTELVGEMLAKDREERPQSAVEVRVRLGVIEALMSGPPTLEVPLDPADLRQPFPRLPRPSGSVTPPDPSAWRGNSSELPLRPPPSNRWLVQAGAALLVLGIGAGGGAYLALRPQPSLPTEEAANAPESVPAVVDGPARAAASEAPPPRAKVPGEEVAGSTEEAPEPAEPTTGATEAAYEETKPEKVRRTAPKPRPSRRARARPQPATPAPSVPAEPAPTEAPPAPTTGHTVITARTVTGEQPEIEVLLDGRILGRGARVKVELRPGSYELAIRRAGETDQQRRTVDIEAGVTTQTKVLLD